MDSDRHRLRSLRGEPRRLESLALYSRFQPPAAEQFVTDRQLEKASELFSADVRELARSASTLHGWRVQNLFRTVTVSLDEVLLIKDEDAGDIYSADSKLKPPDFQVVTRDGDRLMVEVKNTRPKTPTGPFSMSHGELTGLTRYCEMLGVPEPSLGIYWSWWNLWTLVPISALERRGARWQIDLPTAMVHNQMAVLGDFTLGTDSPLALTLYSDPTKPRSLGQDGAFPFTVGRAEYSVGGSVISRPDEQRIAHVLMLFGGWASGDAAVKEVGGDAISITFTVEPEAPVSGQHFQMHSPISSMISAAFNMQTLSAEGEVNALDAPSNRPILVQLIPDDYDGEVLKLWRFRLISADEEGIDRNESAAP